MDGNRRWARDKGLKITVGHTKGYRNIETIVNNAVKKNIPFVTFWAFSTENWNRAKEEVDFLMNIFRKFVGVLQDSVNPQPDTNCFTGRVYVNIGRSTLVGFFNQAINQIND